MDILEVEQKEALRGLRFRRRAVALVEVPPGVPW